MFNYRTLSILLSLICIDQHLFFDFQSIRKEIYETRSYMYNLCYTLLIEKQRYVERHISFVILFSIYLYRIESRFKTFQDRFLFERGSQIKLLSSCSRYFSLCFEKKERKEIYRGDIFYFRRWFLKSYIKPFPSRQIIARILLEEKLFFTQLLSRNKHSYYFSRSSSSSFKFFTTDTQDPLLHSPLQYTIHPSTITLFPSRISPPPHHYSLRSK